MYLVWKQRAFMWFNIYRSLRTCLVLARNLASKPPYSVATRPAIGTVCQRLPILCNCVECGCTRVYAEDMWVKNAYETLAVLRCPDCYYVRISEVLQRDAAELATYTASTKKQMEYAFYSGLDLRSLM